MSDKIGVSTPGEAPRQNGDMAPEVADSTADAPPVGLDRITSSPVPIPSAQGDIFAKKEQAALAHEQLQFQRELGLLGVPFGGKREKPGNISALVIVMIFFFLFTSYLVDTYIHVFHPFIPTGSMPFDKLFAGLTSIITLILGYLFGSNDRSDK